MKIDNSDFGGFIVSKNILNLVPIRYSYREQSTISNLNGWTLYSEKDDDEYVNDSKNFIITTAETLFEIAPVMYEIFNAPYGTDLFWVYEEDTHIGFYDLIKDKETSIQKIMEK